MHSAIVKYSFSESNKKTLVFIPGYSGGLEVPTIKELVDFYTKQGAYNIFGLNLDYQSDALDKFELSQKILIEAVKEISNKASGSSVILFAKSLGGSLAVFNADKLPISKIVVLGCSVVLGWPQRISLLKTGNPIIPNYKNEWKEICEHIDVPTLILTGSSDDLCDNKFLSEVSSVNQNLHLSVIENSNHNLEDTKTSEFKFADVLDDISQFIEI